MNKVNVIRDSIAFQGFDFHLATVEMIPSYETATRYGFDIVDWPTFHKNGLYYINKTDNIPKTIPYNGVDDFVKNADQTIEDCMMYLRENKWNVIMYLVAYGYRDMGTDMPKEWHFKVRGAKI